METHPRGAVAKQTRRNGDGLVGLECYKSRSIRISGSTIYISTHYSHTYFNKAFTMVTVAMPLQNTASGPALEETTEMIEEFNQHKYANDTKFTANQGFEEQAKENEDWTKEKDKAQFRIFSEENERVRNFYYEQHEKQTVAFNQEAREKFAPGKHAKMTMWDALELLNTLVDQSDPDTQFTQIDHALQSAEAMRRDGQPRWMQLTGLIHDTGKLLNFFGVPGQWCVVGDTFPVGCKFSDKIVYGEPSFAKNPDTQDSRYNTEYGMYKPGCGLENVMLSFGHDEYLYNVLKDSKLPKEALAMIRFHSFYPWHREGAYDWMMSEEDKGMKEWVLKFNPYDLYSKSDDLVDVEAAKAYYKELIDEYIPGEIAW